MAVVVEPMLAQLVRDLPRTGVCYEPKWDGFRCGVVREGDEVQLVSRHGRPFARYFPELVEAFRAVPSTDLTIDGEIVLTTERGADFASLMTRLHPAASRVQRLSVETPARFIAFDLVWRDGTDLRGRSFRDRRSELEDLLASPPSRLVVTPITDDVAVAERWLASPPTSGIDGVVAKDPDLPYEPGKRSMRKVKAVRTLDAIVAGSRWMNDRPALGSLLLGLFDERHALRHIGVASSFSEEARQRFHDELLPLAIPLEEHPWAEGFLIDRSPLGRLPGAAGRWTPNMAMHWVPLRLERVCEVTYERIDVDRLRHPATFVRWRPDRDPESCTFEQLTSDGETADTDDEGGIDAEPRRASGA
ncbi:MAG TPA: ATP-dependent DNA ligase [Actinomycetota bacterium]|nr:ATP-dependent DNA ligase [Actinomycetota bacterium]